MNVIRFYGFPSGIFRKISTAKLRGNYVQY